MAEDNIIKIEIVEFDLEDHGDCGHDALVFRDGDSEFSPILRTFCGNYNNIPIKNIFSTQTKMWIRYITNIILEQFLPAAEPSAQVNKSYCAFFSSHYQIFGAWAF